MRLKSHTAPVLVLALLTLVCGARSSWATNSLIVQFDSGTPYAFDSFVYNGLQSATIDTVTSLNAKFDLQSFRALWRADNAPRQNLYRLDFPDSANMDSLLAAYKACPAVSGAALDISIYPLSDPKTVIPIDYWWQHAFDDSSYHYCHQVSGDSLGWRLWHLKAAAVDRAWAITTGDSSVVVAIIDSAYDTTNPDLAPNLFHNPNETYDSADNDHNGYFDDVIGYDFADRDHNVMLDQHWWQRDYWNCAKPNDAPCLRCWNIDVAHLSYEDSAICFPKGDPSAWAYDGFGAQRHGLQMASIISSATNDPSYHRGDVVGYNSHVKIMPLKIGKAIPAGFPEPVDWNTPTKLSAAIEALQYVHSMKTNYAINIRVLNMSMTADRGGNFSYVDSMHVGILYKIINDIRAAGILPVGGAGNAGNSFPVLPCRIPGCLCSGAVYPDGNRNKWSGSNYGGPGTDPVTGRNYGGVDICGYTQHDNVPHYGRGIMTPGFEPWENPYWSFCRTDWGTVFSDTNQMHIDGITPLYTSGTTAQASGMAAMVASAYPQLAPDQIEAMMKRGVDPVDVGGSFEHLLGAGAINAYKTLTMWGHVARDTTLAGKVYVSADIIVDAGHTLTLGAGAELFIAPDNYQSTNPGTKPGIYVNGSLVMNGTESQPVRIHSWSAHDTTGNWEGIYVLPGGWLSATHAIIKHGAYGVDASRTIVLRHCRIDSCVVGVKLEGGSSDSSRIYDVAAIHCDKGFHVANARAEFDGCRADSNGYGWYLENAEFTKVYVHHACAASYNTFDGVFCNAVTDLGPDLWAMHNGRHGIYCVCQQTGTAMYWNEVYGEYNSNGAGVRVEHTQRVEVANSSMRYNLRNVSSGQGAIVVLGDVSQGLGMNNAITDPVLYHVFNGTSSQLKAENCYWMFCEEGAAPYPSFYGTVDCTPYLCSDPSGDKRAVPQEAEGTSKVSRNYPNPFNPCTRMDYYVAKTGMNVRIVIYDVTGRKVKELVDERETRGEHWQIWNGRDACGRMVAAGVYFYSIAIGEDFHKTGKMSLIK